MAWGGASLAGTCHYQPSLHLRLGNLGLVSPEGPHVSLHYQGACVRRRPKKESRLEVSPHATATLICRKNGPQDSLGLRSSRCCRKLALQSSPVSSLQGKLMPVLLKQGIPMDVQPTQPCWKSYIPQHHTSAMEATP